MHGLDCIYRCLRYLKTHQHRPKVILTAVPTTVMPCRATRDLPIHHLPDFPGSQPEVTQYVTPDCCRCELSLVVIVAL
jgi:hypothetical protein